MNGSFSVHFGGKNNWDFTNLNSLSVQTGGRMNGSFGIHVGGVFTKKLTVHFEFICGGSHLWGKDFISVFSSVFSTFFGRSTFCSTFHHWKKKCSTFAVLFYIGVGLMMPQNLVTLGTAQCSLGIKHEIFKLWN